MHIRRIDRVLVNVEKEKSKDACTIAKPSSRLAFLFETRQKKEKNDETVGHEETLVKGTFSFVRSIDGSMSVRGRRS